MSSPLMKRKWVHVPKTKFTVTKCDGNVKSLKTLAYVTELSNYLGETVIDYDNQIKK